MKSICKCDEKVTAQQLGVKVGDKFVVLWPEESYRNEYHNSVVTVGDVLTLIDDDNTSCPIFLNNRTGIELAESFSCLARYEEGAEPPAELSLQNVKFDMKAIAEELGVTLEKAHYIVQTALFERGMKWVTGRTDVSNTHALFLCLHDNGGLSYNENDVYPSYKSVSIKPQYSFYMKEEEKPETIEFNGKQYNKEDVAKALALLSPIN